MTMYTKKISNSWKEYSPYFIFFLIFSPIFISLDFSNGIKFDAWPGNLYVRPSIPISFLVVAFFSIFYSKLLVKNKQLIILFILVSSYITFNLYFGVTRALLVGLGMLLPLISFYVFINIFKNINNTFAKMYLILFSIIVLKFIFDVYHISIQDLDTELSFGHILTNMRFNTTYYFLDSIRIYNYFDYFSFIYYVAVVLSLHNITNNIMLKRSLFLIIVSSIVILNPNSRLFIYGVYLIPALYLFYRIARLKLETYFYLFMTVTISITFLIGFIDFNLNDISLSTRNNHAYNYFHDFKVLNIVLPFNNEYRMTTIGSFHNELLEIFSFFGVVIIYYYYLVMKIYSEVNEKYKLVSFLLMFIIIIGALVQINISNPYIGIMLGMILAILSLENEKLEYAKV